MRKSRHLLRTIVPVVALGILSYTFLSAYWGGPFHDYLASTCICLAIMIVWNRFELAPVKRQPGASLLPRAYPELYLFVEKLTDKLGFPPAALVVITQGMTVRVNKPVLSTRVPGYWILEVGFPFLQVSTVSEFEAAIADAIKNADAPPATDEPEGRTHWVIERYYETCVRPIVLSGYLPPLVEGLERALADASLPVVTPSALTLLDDVASVEYDLMKATFAQNGKALKPIAWDDIGRHLWIPNWIRMAERHQHQLKRLQLKDLYDVATLKETFVVKVSKEENLPIGRRFPYEPIVWVLGAAFACSLRKNWWSLDSSRGTTTFRKGHAVLDPFDIVWEIYWRDIDREDWNSKMEKLGLDPAMPLYHRQ